MEDGNALIGLGVGALALIIAFAGLVFPLAGEFSLGELKDVSLTGVADGQFLGYNATTGNWTNQNLPTEPNIDLAHGLCLWLPFDGVALDKSGYRNDGTSVNVTYSMAHFVSGAVFDGLTSYVDVGNSVLLASDSNYTCSVWFATFGNGVNQYFVCKSSISPTRFSVEFRVTADGLVRNQISDGLSFPTVVSVNGYNDGLWHFAVTQLLKGKWLALFVDNVLVSNVTDTTGVITSTNAMVVGAQYRVAPPSYCFNGTLDDFRLYNRVLSGAEINALYTLGV